MNDNKINENVAEIEKYLRKIDHAIRKKGREIISESNITVPQFQALQILIRNEELTIGELSQKMALACSTITDLIDRMEKSELVIRKRNEKDKRVVLIEVLPKGHDILGKVLEKRREYLKNKISSFDLEKIENLGRELEALYNAIDNED